MQTAWVMSKGGRVRSSRRFEGFEVFVFVDSAPPICTLSISVASNRRAFDKFGLSLCTVAVFLYHSRDSSWVGY